MTYPVRNRKRGVLLVSAVGFLILFWTTVCVVFRSGAVFLSAPAVFLLTVLLALCERYIFAEYAYSVENGRFMAQAYVFRKKTSFISLPLAEINSLLSVPEWRCRRQAMKKSGKQYVYRDLCPDFLPKVSKVIVFDTADGTVAVRVQLDLKPSELGL